MAEADRYSGYPLSFISSAGPPVTTHFRQLSSLTVTPGTTKTTINPMGDIDPATHIISHADPQVTIVTRDLTTVLGIISPTSGLALTGAFTARYQHRTDLGTFEAAAGVLHDQITGTGGFIFLNSLSASQDAVEGVTASLTYMPLWDGSTDPLVHVTDVAIDATSPGFISQFYMGPIYINDVEITGIQSWNIDFGLTFSVKRTQGSPYAKQGVIVTRSPTISFTTLAMDEGATLDAFARPLAGAIDVYCARGVASGDRAAYPAGNNHIQLAWSAGDWEHEDVSVSDNDDATVTFTARPTTAATLDITANIPQ